jgi:thioesterase domain-containing protein
MDSLPMTASGKIDRGALPPPSTEGLPSHGYRAPANEDERALVSIWEEILKLSKIGIDDNFFELGGTSLQTLILFDRIKTLLSRNLPPSAIICAPTIAQLAELMRQEGTLGTAGSLVPFRLSGGNEPLYMMHGNNGSIFYVRYLLTDLKSNRPVYGLQPPPLDGAHRILHTIESMATSYVAEIRRVQPRGPYFLMGYSFGGWVVFEMAQQLVQEGERVNFLGMIDTMARRPPVPSRAARLRCGIQGLPRQKVPLYLLLRVYKSLAFRTKIRKRVAALRLNALRRLFKRTMSDTQRSDYYEWLCARARRQYVPRPYSGHLTIFSSAGNSEWQKLCWKPLVQGGLTVLELPAGHLEMIWPPHSKLLARKVDECMERLEPIREVWNS